MKGQTLGDIFSGADLRRSAKQYFSETDMKKTADLAAAETIENASELVASLTATATDQLLDVSLEDILMGAWTRMFALQQFAVGENLTSNKTHKFLLTEHKVTSKHSPSIELFVYDTKVAEVPFDIVLTLIFARTKLMIKHGRIMEVRISGCQAMGKLSCQGQLVLEKKSTELEFPSAIKLGDGIAIPPPLKRKVA